MRVHFWISEMCEVPLSLLPGPLSLVVVETVRFLSMGQEDLYGNYSNLIEPCAKKPVRKQINQKYKFERYFLASWYKITPDGLTCRPNQSINQSVIVCHGYPNAWWVGTFPNSKQYNTHTHTLNPACTHTHNSYIYTHTHTTWWRTQRKMMLTSQLWRPITIHVLKGHDKWWRTRNIKNLTFCSHF